MIHISNFGSFGRNLQQYADTRGFLPEEDDAVEDFHYSFEIDEEWLGEVKLRVSEELNKSLDALNEWRDS